MMVALEKERGMFNLNFYYEMQVGTPWPQFKSKPWKFRSAKKFWLWWLYESCPFCLWYRPLYAPNLLKNNLEINELLLGLQFRRRLLQIWKESFLISKVLFYLLRYTSIILESFPALNTFKRVYNITYVDTWNKKMAYWVYVWRKSI